MKKQQHKADAAKKQSRIDISTAKDKEEKEHGHEDHEQYGLVQGRSSLLMRVHSYLPLL